MICNICKAKTKVNTVYTGASDKNKTYQYDRIKRNNYTIRHRLCTCENRTVSIELDFNEFLRLINSKKASKKKNNIIAP